MNDHVSFQPGISLCMIVKNAASCLAAAIESVRPLINEVIVVDTGSTDNTNQVAERYGARIFDYPWSDDFSKPRNFSLKQATHTWVLVLDADEQIAKKDHKQIQEAMALNRSDAFVLQQRNYCNSPDAEGWQTCKGMYQEERDFAGYFDVPIIRFFRNDDRIYYQGIVHEVVDETIRSMKKGYLDVCIHHYASFDNQKYRQQKSEYYLSLLLKEFERDPDNSKTWFLIGRQYYSMGKFAEAIAFLDQVIAGGSLCEMAYDNLAAAYVQVGLMAEARIVLEKLLKINPRYYEAYPTLGIVYYELGLVNEAFDTLQKGIKKNPFSFRLQFNLTSILFKEKNYQEAALHIEQARSLNPHIARVYYLGFFIFYECGQHAQALAYAERLKKLDVLLFKKIQEQYDKVKNSAFAHKGALK